MVGTAGTLGKGNRLALALIAACGAAGCGGPGPEAEAGLDVVELDIAGIHRGLQAGDFTCVELVAAYLARIEAYDRQGPALHAIVTVNSQAMERAAEADGRLAGSGLDPDRPLECVPMIVKDNYDTADLPTSAGSASLEDSIPPDDAFQVQRIREAGAIVLAKSHMAEFAFSAYQSLGSVIPATSGTPTTPTGCRPGPRRHRGRRGRELRSRRPRDGHRQLHPRAVVPQRPLRHPVDDGPDEPGRDRAAQPLPGHRRSDGAHGQRRGAGLRRAGGAGPGRRGHRGVRARGRLSPVPRRGTAHRLPDRRGPPTQRYRDRGCRHRGALRSRPRRPRSAGGHRRRPGADRGARSRGIPVVQPLPRPARGLSGEPRTERSGDDARGAGGGRRLPSVDPAKARNRARGGGRTGRHLRRSKPARR